MRPNIKAILSATDIFDNLSAPQLELIMNICELFHYQSGDLLFREYEKTTELYVIGRGGVKIVMDPGVVGSEAEQKNVQPAILTELRQGQPWGVWRGKRQVHEQGLILRACTVCLDGRHRFLER